VPKDRFSIFRLLSRCLVLQNDNIVIRNHNPDMRPDSPVKLWRYITHLLIYFLYLLTYLLAC